MHRYGYVVLLLVSTFFFGSIGVLTRDLESYGISSYGIAFIRFSVSVVIMFFIILIFKRECLRIRAKDIWVFVVFGLFKLMSDIALFFAQTHGPLALASMLQLTSPYFVMFFSLFFFKEGITVKKLIAVAFAIIGCIMATGVLTSGMDMQTGGLIAGLVSGVCYSLYFIGSQVSSDKGYDAVTSFFYIFLFSMIASIPFAASDMGLIFEAFVKPDLMLDLLLLGIAATLVPFFIIMVSVRKIGSTVTSMICLSEIIFSALFGYVMFDEELGPANIVGIVLVILSIAIINIKLDYNARMKAVEDKLNVEVIDGNAPSRLANKFSFRKNKGDL